MKNGWVKHLLIIKIMLSNFKEVMLFYIMKLLRMI